MRNRHVKNRSGEVDFDVNRELCKNKTTGSKGKE